MLGVKLGAEELPRSPARALFTFPRALMHRCGGLVDRYNFSPRTRRDALLGLVNSSHHHACQTSSIFMLSPLTTRAAAATAASTVAAGENDPNVQFQSQPKPFPQSPAPRIFPWPADDKTNRKRTYGSYQRRRTALHTPPDRTYSNHTSRATALHRVGRTFQGSSPLLAAAPHTPSTRQSSSDKG